MEFALFIVPITMIFVQIIKNMNVMDDTRWLPAISCTFGGLCGLAFASYYGGDYFMLIVNGISFGAAASGIYDVGAAVKSPQGV